MNCKFCGEEILESNFPFCLDFDFDKNGFFRKSLCQHDYLAVIKIDIILKILLSEEDKEIYKKFTGKPAPEVEK